MSGPTAELGKTFEDRWRQLAATMPKSMPKAHREMIKRIYVHGALSAVEFSENMVGSIGLKLEKRRLAARAFDRMKRDLIDHETWETMAPPEPLPLDKEAP
jgi:hypothetical protein